MKIEIELTDTFGGDANYSWVRRYTLNTPENISQRALVRRIKKAANITGVRCASSNYGDTLELRPVGACVVLFATFS